MSLELDASQEVGSLQSGTQCSQCQSLQSQEVRLGRLVQGSQGVVQAHGVVPPAQPALHTEHCWRRLEPVPDQVDNVPLVLDLVPDEIDRVVQVPGQVDKVPRVLGLVPDDVDVVQPVGSLGTPLLTAGVGW